MASFQIHEDQENRVRDINQKSNGIMPVQQKRAVLSALDNNNPDRLGNKQVLGLKNAKVNNENAFKKQLPKKQPTPVVPVAEFKAFKVYEDNNEDRINKELLERNRRRKDKENYSNIYKVNEDRLITKKEVEERLQHEPELAKLLNIQKEKPLSPISKIGFHDCPMNLEKPLEEDVNIPTIAKSRNMKDSFFEMKEFREDIYLYLCEREKLNRPRPGYMKKQPDITYNMRTILIDWLVEVAEEYKLHTETLYLAVNYIDRFLSCMSVVRGKLQLVGTAAMYIASKYEEIHPPDVGEFVYITDDTYNKHQVIRMEMLIVKILDFELSMPTPYTFVTALCIAHKMTEKVMNLAMYLCELSLLEAEPTLETLPSIMACSAIAIARHTLDEDVWPKELSLYTGHELKDLHNSIEFLHDLFVKSQMLEQKAIQEKYKSGNYLHVSNLKPKDISLIIN